ncbi:hypothetical protein Clacol_007222 [Clathrus columnatus]|uniref:Uncharacterized protein n=1 Tax=Clathrus columnatus TaxID=1419009 RepID=A0AAV5AFC5_9AGAM|nr:hypothetical protein Clacol_007222 [Clathrus columnatus]
MGRDGYDTVPVASDAIGMGLNFGRGGRFGKAGVEQAIVTCMSEEYMPTPRKAFQGKPQLCDGAYNRYHARRV